MAGPSVIKNRFFIFLVISVSLFLNINAKDVIVKLFEWKWDDVADECEQFLAPNGFEAVEVSPPSEHRVIETSFHQRGLIRPWIERYQIVSYKLVSRSGNETQFADMVRRCNNVGVRVYVEAVINHMTSPDGRGGLGIGNNSYSGTSKVFDGVPYDADSFHNENDCNTPFQLIQNLSDPIQMRNCRLMGFLDLDHSKESVQNSVAGYLNHLIHLGVSGFRINSANYIWPKDLQIIYKMLIDLPVQHFPKHSKPFIYHEIFNSLFSIEEYLNYGKVTEFYYSALLNEMLKKKEGLGELKVFAEDEVDLISSGKAIVFVDHQDLQRMIPENSLSFRDGKLFHLANIILLSFPYGQPIIMSSYFWLRHIENNNDQNKWIGPPTNDNYETLSVIRFSNNTCGNGWVCEHRNAITTKMVKFHNYVANTRLHNWWNNDFNDQIAFSRGNRGFVVINNRLEDMTNIKLQTGLLPGQYCDIVSGEMINNTCTGKIIKVNADREAIISILQNETVPAVVIVSISLLREIQSTSITMTMTTSIMMTVTEENNFQELLNNITKSMIDINSTPTAIKIEAVVYNNNTFMLKDSQDDMKSNLALKGLNIIESLLLFLFITSISILL